MSPALAPTWLTHVLRPRLRTLDATHTGGVPDCRHSDFDLDPHLAPGARSLRPAAVLVPLVEHTTGITVLLTQRTAHLTHHAGQVSFPGGREEPDDASPLATALREANEEIGLAPQRCVPLGLLDDYETVTRFIVRPVVAAVRPGFRLSLDAFEVADAFEVPLAFLLDPRNHEVGTHERDGQRRHYYQFRYEKRLIWGATAGMLMNLYRRLHGLRGDMRPLDTAPERESH